MKTKMECDCQGAYAAEMDLVIDGVERLCTVDFVYTCVDVYELGTRYSAPWSEIRDEELILNRIEIFDDNQDIVEIDIERMDNKQLEAIKYKLQDYATQNLQEI